MEADEQFFNVEFWRSLVAVFLGALLGFGAALAVGVALNWLRRRRYAKTVRNAIATECIYNLIALNESDTQIERTVTGNFATVYSHRFPPRGSVLRAFVTADAMGALSNRERGSLVVVSPELENAAAVYEGWKQIARSPSEPGNSREEETNHCRWVIGASGRNVLGLLILVCGHAGRDDLRDERARRMADKLTHLKTRPVPNFVRALKSSATKSENLDEIVKDRRYQVVWEHDWPDCPMDVIELRSCVDRKVIRFLE